MKKHLAIIPVAITFLLAVCGCGQKGEKYPADEKSYAIYAEFAKHPSKKMVGGLNRRILDTIMVQHGKNIMLEKGGYVSLYPGTYRISGFSMVTMQTKLSAPILPADSQNYPGYCFVMPEKWEINKDSALKYNIGLGAAVPAFNTTPSNFDFVYTCSEKTRICLVHQVGDKLTADIYLWVYPANNPSPYHVVAQVAITEL